MNKISVNLFAIMLIVISCVSEVWGIEPDDYLGDAAIYTGMPNERPKPNVLLIIDTSQATMSSAAGTPYAPTVSYSSPLNFANNQIYEGNNQGVFSPLGLLVSDVSCITNYEVTDPISGVVSTKSVDVNHILSTYGTYSGAGSDKAPNLSDNGACDLAPKGSVYATGNYLNFVNSAALASTDTVIIQHTYNEVKGNKTNTIVGKFELSRNISIATADMEPGVGSESDIYWTKLTTTGPKADHRDVTHEIVSGSLLPVSDPDAPNDGWFLGASYYSESLDPTLTKIKTQRESFYDALVPVINGASPSVNFGFLTYNPNNQGAVLGMDIADYGDNPSAMIAALPTVDALGNIVGPSLIASGPNRPQSEALYDAGHYFRVLYKKTDGTLPNKQSVNLTSQVPLDIENNCGYNHIIFLTNGLPNQDTGTPDLGDVDNDMWSNEAVYGAGSHYLDDVAYYLHNKVDINSDGKTGDITVHMVLAFQAEDELLRNAAEDGGGAFYNAFDTNGLSKALTEILAGIVNDVDTAFVAPVVPASTANRIASGNNVYLGLFKPQTNAPWQGNLKKYKVDASTSQLLDVYGHPATDSNGEFIYSQSYWGGPVDSGGNITALLSADGTRNIVPPTYDPKTGSIDTNGGDGGLVNAGGIGGTLLARDIVNNPRKIVTFLDAEHTSLPITASKNLMAAQNRILPTAGSIDNPWASGNNYLQYDHTFGIDAPDAVIGEIEKNKLIKFLHGFDAFSSAPNNKRSWLMGDILHSKPLVFNYTKYSESEEFLCTANPSVLGHSRFNSSIIFVGANDGMLHAFRDCDGEELWAFAPPELLKRLKYVVEPGHNYFVDAPPTLFVHDVDNDGEIETPDQDGNYDKVIIIFGLRRGGGNAFLTNDPRGSYYALDVTNPMAPKYLWGINSNTANLEEMGETWSQPRLAKVMDGPVSKVVMFVGAGYDNNEDLRWGNTQKFPAGTTVTSPAYDPAIDTDTTLESADGVAITGGDGVGKMGTTSDKTGTQVNPKGRGLYAIEVARLTQNAAKEYIADTTHSGSYVWSYTAADDANMTFSIPSDLIVADLNGDKYADRIYVGDTGGQIWRFNLEGNNKNNWTADVIFKTFPGLTDDLVDNTEGRKIFYRPALAYNGDSVYLFFGSGDREHPLNLGSSDRLYMIVDRGQGAKNNVNGVKTEADLVDVTSNALQDSSDTALVQDILKELYDKNNYGWYIRLENVGEKMLAPPVLISGQVFYTTYSPIIGALDDCTVGNLGYSRLYHLNYRTGEAVYNYDVSNDSDALADGSRALSFEGYVLKKSDRVRNLGEGIPSGIVTMLDASGKATIMVSASNRVGVYSAPDIKLLLPVYWMEWNK